MYISNNKNTQTTLAPVLNVEIGNLSWTTTEFCSVCS